MIKKRIRESILNSIKELYGEVEELKFDVEKPKREVYGDYATNVALVLRGKLKGNPLEIAEKIAERLRKEKIFEKVEVAPPGFINFWISFNYYLENLQEIIERGEEYGRSSIGEGKKVLVEFVSANPTGPLHIGHGRGAGYGDSLARVLEFTGHTVVREYYINDKGTQIDILGNSVYLRAKELKGENVNFPEDHYKGEYIYDVAKKILKTHPDLLEIEKEKALEICKKEAVEIILDEIKKDLEDFRVFYDNWYSEKGLYERGKVKEVLEVLKEKGFLYEKDGALWFASSKFGDEKDRVLVKSTGEFTYFAGDIAYHYEKFVERGFDICVNVWGADHHGYVPRLKSALKGLGLNPDALKVILIQMVNLLEGGEVKSMSTRAGEFVTLKELMNDVGVDATRFIFLSRSSDSPLDFDVELAKKQSQENPVYYVQYAHARICSVFEKAKEKGIEEPNWKKVDFSLLKEPAEVKILKMLAVFKEVVEDSALSFSPYKITYYLLELASMFHEYYTKHRILSEDRALSQARLGLCLGCKHIIKAGLKLLGVSAPEKM